MKVLFAGGGGSGGHFYPIIAVARALRKVAAEEHIIALELFFAADQAFDERTLKEEQIEFIKIVSGKIPRYPSLQYLTSPFLIVFGFFKAFLLLYKLLPDVILSKGGYSAVPILLAARILRIPVVVHESDVVPGMVNHWAGAWAARVAISFPQSVANFKNTSVALTGNPIRHQVVGGNEREAFETFTLEEGIPILLVLGGSQGAERINEIILDILPEATTRYQIIHQTGSTNYQDIAGRSEVVLEKSQFKHRYHSFSFLEESDLRNASRVASLIIARAGAGAIFEIAAWRVPAILIPLGQAAQDHQRENAYAYARTGGAEVVEEENLTPHIVLSAVDKILNDPAKVASMKRAAQEFARLDAAELIAQEILKLGIHD